MTNNSPNSSTTADKKTTTAEGDVVGRDTVVTTTAIEGGPVARHAVIGVIAIAALAIIAMAWLVSRRIPEPQASSTQTLSMPTPVTLYPHNFDSEILAISLAILAAILLVVFTVIVRVVRLAKLKATKAPLTGEQLAKLKSNESAFLSAVDIDFSSLLAEDD